MTTECIGEIKVTLAEKLSEYLSAKVPGFSSTEHLDSSFSSLGLDSVSHVEMTAMIEDHLQIKVDPALAFDYPTINSLVNYLQQSLVEVTDNSLVNYLQQSLVEVTDNSLVNSLQQSFVEVSELQEQG